MITRTHDVTVAHRRCGPRARLATRLPIALLAALLGACSSEPPTQGQNQPPIASFSAVPLQGVAPLDVTFDASGSSDADGTIVSYAWQFGDGQTGSGVTVQHTYAEPAAYTARLTVTDDAGATGSAQRTITVTDADGNVPPTAAFTATPGEGQAPLTVTFDASASQASAGTIVSYVWDFGDGGAGTGSTATHTYLAPGSYVARLTVTDGGGSASATATITVTGGDTGAGEQTRTMETSFVMTEAVFGEPHRLIAGSIDAALEATRLNGGTGTLTGTLTETAPEVFTYTATPNDRLRLQLLDGRIVEITFVAAPQGDFAGDGLRFLRSPHVIDARVTSNAAAGSLDVSVASSPGETAGTQVGRFAGSFADGAGQGWTTAVDYESFRRTEVGIDYNELESILYMKGTLQSASRGIAIDLERYNRYKLINTVEQVDERMDHSIAWGGDSYRLAGRVTMSRRDSKPVDRDQWVIAGTLTRNGATIGQYEASEDVSGLAVRLQIGAEQFRLYFFGYL